MNNIHENPGHYSFRHIKSGKIVISKDWSEFYRLQKDDDYQECYHLNYSTRSDYRLKTSTLSCKLQEQRNKFWKGARGFEKVGRLRDCGIFPSSINEGIRFFLKELHNHACMLGDKELVNKTIEADKWFWVRGNASAFALPQH